MPTAVTSRDASHAACPPFEQAPRQCLWSALCRWQWSSSCIEPAERVGAIPENQSCDASSLTRYQPRLPAPVVFGRRTQALASHGASTIDLRPPRSMACDRAACMNVAAVKLLVAATDAAEHFASGRSPPFGDATHMAWPETPRCRSEHLPSPYSAGRAAANLAARLPLLLAPCCPVGSPVRGADKPAGNDDVLPDTAMAKVVQPTPGLLLAMEGTCRVRIFARK